MSDTKPFWAMRAMGVIGLMGVIALASAAQPATNSPPAEPVSALSNWVARSCPVLSVRAVYGWGYTVYRSDHAGNPVGEHDPIWFIFLSFTNDQIHVPDLASPRRPFYSVRAVRRLGTNLLPGVIITSGPPCMVFANADRWATNFPSLSATSDLHDPFVPISSTRQATCFCAYIIDFASRAD